MGTMSTTEKVLTVKVTTDEYGATAVVHTPGLSNVYAATRAAFGKTTARERACLAALNGYAEIRGGRIDSHDRALWFVKGRTEMKVVIEG